MQSADHLEHRQIHIRQAAANQIAVPGTIVREYAPAQARHIHVVGTRRLQRQADELDAALNQRPVAQLI